MGGWLDSSFFFCFPHPQLIYWSEIQFIHLCVQLEHKAKMKTEADKAEGDIEFRMDDLDQEAGMDDIEGTTSKLKVANRALPTISTSSHGSLSALLPLLYP